MNPRQAPTIRRIFTVAVLMTGCWSQSGCVRLIAIGTKVFHGDPTVVSTFEQRTQVELQTGEHRVAVLVDAPHRIQDQYERLVPKVQAELVRMMRRHGVQVIDPADVEGAIEAAGGVFTPDSLARAVDADYILHAEITSYTDEMPGSQNLLNFRASGMVRGYEAREVPDQPERQIVARYEEPFLAKHPQGQPLLADQTTQRTYFQECTRAIASSIGQQTYDVLTSELY